MKRNAPTTDLFSAGLSATSAPKLLPKLPATPQEESQLRAELWETAPKHLKGVVRGLNSIYYEAMWTPIDKLTAQEIIACFALN